MRKHIVAHQVYKYESKLYLMDINININKAVDYFIKNSQRAQALFLATIEKPRTYDDVASIFKMIKNSFYAKEFHDIFSQTGFVKVEYFGRKPYIYALFDEPFFAYFEKCLGVAEIGLSRELASELIKDKAILKEIFNSQDFRSLWKEETLSAIDKNMLKDPFYLSFLILTSLVFLTLVYMYKERYQFDFKSAKETAVGFLLFIMKGLYRSGISFNVVLKLSDYFREDMKTLEKIKETEFYKKSIVYGEKLLKLISEKKLDLSVLHSLWKMSKEEFVFG